jgi:hypothetical protein
LTLPRGGRRDRRRHAAWLAAAIALVGVGLTSSIAASTSWARRSSAAPVIVSGTLLNGLRHPVTAVTVGLYSSSPLDQRTLTKPLRIGSATTDRNGRFVVRAAYSPTLQQRASRNGTWLKLDLLTGDTHLTAHRIVRRRFVSGRWVGPTKAGRTDLGVLVLAAGQPSVATTTHQGSTAAAEGWIYGVVEREPGGDPRSGSSTGPTVPVAGDTIVARFAAGSASTVSARDGSFQMRLPTGLVTLTEDICGVSKQVTIESSAATRVTLEIPNSC